MQTVPRELPDNAQELKKLLLQERELSAEKDARIEQLTEQYQQILEHHCLLLCILIFHFLKRPCILSPRNAQSRLTADINCAVFEHTMHVCVCVPELSFLCGQSAPPSALRAHRIFIC